jgi:hypothetical protein
MKAPQDPTAVPEWLEIIRQKVASLHYGVVQVIVHEGRVTQIERTEKTRLDSAASELRRRENY